MATQTLSQYCSSSWQLTVHSEPSPLSQWAGETIVGHLQFQLVRLPSVAWKSDNAPEPVLQGPGAVLQGLHGAVQSYLEQHLGQGLVLGLVPGFIPELVPQEPDPEQTPAAIGAVDWLPFRPGELLGSASVSFDPASSPNQTIGKHQTIGKNLLETVPIEAPPDTAPPNAALPIEETDSPDLKPSLSLNLDAETLASLESPGLTASNPSGPESAGPASHNPEFPVPALARLSHPADATPAIHLEALPPLRHRLSIHSTPNPNHTPRLNNPNPGSLSPDPTLRDLNSGKTQDNPNLKNPNPKNPNPRKTPDQILEITTLELFDLVDVLDQWQGSMALLPGWQTPPKSQPRPWVRSAALVLVTMGVTVGGMQLIQSGRDRVALSPEAQRAETAPVTADAPHTGNGIDRLPPPPGANPDFNLSTHLEVGPTLDSANENTDAASSDPNGINSSGLNPNSDPLSLGNSQPLPRSSTANLPPPPPAPWLILPPPPAPRSGPSTQTSTPGSVAPPPSTSSRSAPPSTPSSVPPPARSEAEIAALGDQVPGARSAASENRNLAAETARLDAAIRSGPTSSPANLDAAAPLGAAGSIPAEEVPPTEDITQTQVAAVRSYFQRVWQAPNSLSQPLQYGLVVGSKGELRAIDPQDNAAGNFLDRTGMPLLGDPFVPAPADGRNRSLSLTLYPDNRVEVYSLGTW